MMQQVVMTLLGLLTFDDDVMEVEIFNSDWTSCQLIYNFFFQIISQV